ncbi:unnamed protein product [Gongylonema pulchrum]|uniref:THUMP domain-containing protein n=1 Tax=Gongylonema pulchrum TaxID=637853 RepID=A0A183EGW5_9BILA|nr:unnamed protein product [Gongylonema pulchrum]
MLVIRSGGAGALIVIRVICFGECFTAEESARVLMALLDITKRWQIIPYLKVVEGPTEMRLSDSQWIRFIF